MTSDNISDICKQMSSANCENNDNILQHIPTITERAYRYLLNTDVINQ